MIRIAPATFYNDSSLNAAIKDDERIMSIFHHPEKVTITHVDKNTGENIKIKPVSNVESTFNVSTNYYVYCMADSYSLRLFDDFESNACIIIHDMYGFLRKLEKAFMQVVGNWGFGAEQVKYIDPLNPPNEKDIDVFFSKHFRCSYQKEIRAVLLPSIAVEKLDPIYLNIGSMEEYADYIEF